MPDADDSELLAWLRLCNTTGVGDESLRRLLAAFGSAKAVLDAGPGAWHEIAGSACARLLADPEVQRQVEGRARQAMAWLAEAPEQRHLLTLADAAYPAALLQTADPPCLLYAMGSLHWLQAPALAIVGSRHATPQGLSNAAQFAQALSEAGLTVVSGLAMGIDGAAHKGALKGRGSTIAVVGTGLDRVYPSRHLALARQIAEQGLVLSEFGLGTPSLAANFPRRNRIIAGLSLGTLVVEAALKSGSLITARLASECGREVYAVPGSILSAQSAGCHWLIKQGARLVESAEDVLEDLQPQLKDGSLAASALSAINISKHVSSPHEDPLLNVMGHDPITLDALSDRCGWPMSQLQARLLELELEGLVQRLPGGLLVRQGSG
jgi:DNA processing protein